MLATKEDRGRVNKVISRVQTLNLTYLNTSGDRDESGKFQDCVTSMGRGIITFHLDFACYFKGTPMSIQQPSRREASRLTLKSRDLLVARRSASFRPAQYMSCLP